MPIRPLIFVALLLVANPAAHAQEHSHDNSHGDRLHFTHPLVTESISPDTKVRLDYVYSTPGSDHETEIEGEYAFHPSFSIEGGVHYDLSGGNLGETHVLFKFANYAFAERGVLLGYGIAFGLPTGSGGHHDTGDDHGHDGHAPAAGESDIYEIEPFLNGGITRGPLEISGWARFAIPTNQETQSEVGTSLRYDISTLYHVGRRLDVLAELNGASGLSGVASGEATASVVPSVRLRPFLDVDLVAGIGAAFPLTGHEDVDSRAIISLFFHF